MKPTKWQFLLFKELIFQALTKSSSNEEVNTVDINFKYRSLKGNALNCTLLQWDDACHLKNTYLSFCLFVMEDEELKDTA